MSRFGFFHPFSRSDFFDLPQYRMPDSRWGFGFGDDSGFISPRKDYYARPRRDSEQKQSSGVSELHNDADKFQVLLDVNQFTPDEISVKTVDNFVVVQGKHGERLDEHGYVSREFQRRYILPESVDPETVSSALSHDGILTIEAPKKEAIKRKERIIPIQKENGPEEPAKNSETDKGEPQQN